jgi:predicted AlkP superfamily pyrophosphatase or phosphodiesterase
VRSFAEIPGEIIRRTAAGERVALVLLDALGLELLTREQDHPLMRRLQIMPLDSQFPSTTAAHVTTMHLGQPVEQHGLYEWRVLEPTLDEVIVPLRFRRDTSDIDAELDGRLNPRALIDSTTLYESLATRSAVVGALTINGSPFNRAATAGARLITAETLDQSLELLARAMRADPGLGYGYVYWPQIDAVGHRHGPSSPQFRAAARSALDAIASHISEFHRNGVTVLVTADHGQSDVHPDRVDYLDGLWPELSEHLTQRAAGSCRDVFLHVENGTVDHVIEQLSARLDGRAHVCRAIELFTDPGPKLLARLGDVAVLPADGREAWLKATASVKTWNLGQHGGRTSTETATYLARVDS